MKSAGRELCHVNTDIILPLNLKETASNNEQEACRWDSAEFKY